MPQVRGFPGYGSPRFTQIPDAFFDEYLPDLGQAEVKVLLVIMRHTYGHGKAKPAISLSQLEQATGLTRQAISRATKSLEEHGHLVVERRQDPERGLLTNIYSLSLAKPGASSPD